MSKEKKKGSCFGTILKVLLVVVLIFAALIAYVDWSSKKDAEKREAEKLAEYTEFVWPTSDLAKKVPKPNDLSKGKVVNDSEDSFTVELAKIDKTGYTAYVEACKTAGFTVDYSASDSLYTADDAVGNHIYVSLDTDGYMRISANIPENTTEESFETLTSTPEPETTEETTSAPDETDVSGLRTDFKEAMDSYEEFMNEYVDFMTKYNESSDVASMAVDYANYISKYAEMSKKFDAWESEDLNDVEMNYYIDVQTRVLKKLASVQ